MTASRFPRLRSERGAELVEFVFILPVLLLVVAGIIDFGFLFQRYESLTNAAREGARVGILPGYQEADVISRVNAFVAAAGLPVLATPPVVTYPIVDPGGGRPTYQTVNVEVQQDYTFFILGPIAPLVGGSFGTITLTARSAMRVEGG